MNNNRLDIKEVPKDVRKIILSELEPKDYISAIESSRVWPKDEDQYEEKKNEHETISKKRKREEEVNEIKNSMIGILSSITKDKDKEENNEEGDDNEDRDDNEEGEDDNDNVEKDDNVEEDDNIEEEKERPADISNFFSQLMNSKAFSSLLNNVMDSVEKIPKDDNPNPEEFVQSFISSINENTMSDFSKELEGIEFDSIKVQNIFNNFGENPADVIANIHPEEKN